MKITKEELLNIIREEGAAAAAAKKAGLVHLGFGNWGPKKGGKVTHQSKDGKLVPVGGDPPTKDDAEGGEGDEKYDWRTPEGAKSYIYTDTKDGKELSDLLDKDELSKKDAIRAISLLQRSTHGAGPEGEEVLTKLVKDKYIGESVVNESVNFHTISGNKRFMTKTALPIVRKYGVKNVKVSQVGGDFLEIRFPIDSNKLKKLDKELKKKNRTAYGGIVENRRNRMTKKELREMVREIIKEEESFGGTIPATVERYMKKFVDSVKSANLNRKRKITILGRTVEALGLDPSELMKYTRLVKKGL